MNARPRIAIIGAGLSGLVLAQALHAQASVRVFEKARGVGGRMATRYAAPYFFDHGTQFFTARTPEFQAFLAPLVSAAVVAEWRGKVITLAAGQPVKKRLWFEPHYVATPQMNSLCKYLAAEQDVVLSTEVAPLTAKTAAGWQLQDAAGNALGSYDWVLSTAPPVQTARLLQAVAPPLPALAAAPMLGCYTLMLGFNRPWAQGWIAAKIADSLLDWVAVNSSKPARDTAVTCLVAHATHAWSEAHIDGDMPTAQAQLLAALQQVSGIDGASADFITTHRWRYAATSADGAGQPLLLPELQLASVGDWCAHSRIEAVWQMATRLAQMVRQVL
jgi:renalase